MNNKKYRREDVENDWTQFRSNMTRLLDGRGMRKADLAHDLNMAVGTVTRWFYERGPDLRTAWILADYFKVSIDWLIGRSSERYSVLDQNSKDLLDRYNAASDQDRLVVDTLLSKYAER